MMLELPNPFILVSARIITELVPGHVGDFCRTASVVLGEPVGFLACHSFVHLLALCCLVRCLTLLLAAVCVFAALWVRLSGGEMQRQLTEVLISYHRKRVIDLPERE